jgi:uncharacterized protein
MTETEYIFKESAIPKNQIESTLKLLKDGATIPFIARYRKEATGNLDEEQIDTILKKSSQFEQIEKRKAHILAAIEKLEKLTDPLKEKIITCYDLLKLEDLYLPYKQKRQTNADKAIQAGLGNLAIRILKQENGDPVRWAEEKISKDFPDAESVLSGAIDIVADSIVQNDHVRERMRKSFFEFSQLECKVVPAKKAEAEKYLDYFDLKQPLNKCPSYRLLAILRGENEGFLKVKIEPSLEYSLTWLEKFYVKNNNAAADLVVKAIRQAYKKSLQPSFEAEAREYYKNLADDQSIKTFSKNLEKLLLAPPVGNKRVLAIDPGFKSGCKVVVMDETGTLVHNVNIYPHPPQQEFAKAQSKIAQLVEMYKVEVIAIGDGTAGRETESFIKKIRFENDLQVYVVREDGASIYSASKVAREEFPDFDITVRGAVSIGRRLMDPLAELVKIDPKSLGVGQYQHDVNQTKLQQELDRVIESAVNKVGVDVNTASKYLLSHIAGLGPKLAENIVAHRQKNGLFKSRADILAVERMGQKAYEQAAGFLRIKSAKNPLDNSAVHPEQYKFIEKLAKNEGVDLNQLIGNKELVLKLRQSVKSEVGIGEYTLNDIFKELEKPGLDPRKTARVFEFSKEIKTMGDLSVGLELNGIVTNVTDFGAFVNIGIKENGLLHKSKLTKNNNEHPSDYIGLHDQLKVRVVLIDTERKRIGLELAD